MISDLSPYRLDLARRLGGKVVDLRERTKARAEEFGAGYYLDIQEMLDRKWIESVLTS